MKSHPCKVHNGLHENQIAEMFFKSANMKFNAFQACRTILIYFYVHD